jgi:outer membrane receptor protein involved in Fe transport
VGAPIGQLNPIVLYDPTTLGGYLGAQIAAGLIAGGMPAAQAQATAAQAAPALTAVMAKLPQGTLAMTNAKLAGDQSIIATYTAGVGTVDVRGYDVAIDWQASDNWLLAATYSKQDKIVFAEIGGAANPLMSNSPKDRASANIHYSDDANGFGADLGVRYSDTFPVNSGLLNSLGIPPNPVGTQLYPAVPTQALFDVGASWRLPIEPKVTWSISIQNINDQRVPTFVGTAPIGRLAMTRMQWTF